MEIYGLAPTKALIISTGANNRFNNLYFNHQILLAIQLEVSGQLFFQAIVFCGLEAGTGYISLILKQEITQVILVQYHRT